MSDTSRRVALFGTEEPLPESLVLEAGPVSVELENGALRYVRYQGVEVIRGIAYLYRDRNWATPAPEISNQQIRKDGGGFEVAYDARIESGGQAFVYRADIRAGADGALRFEVTGRAETEVVANRIGFVVLHPLDGVAGEPVEVTHADGSVEKSRFPRLVSPDQPFFDLRALAHQVVPGVWATCTMEGDAFEMEDHRNWMDASFKTYVRPLSKPRPFTLAPGEELVQRVSLTFRGQPTSRPAPRERAVTVTLGDEGGPMPQIGLGVPPEEAKPALAAADLMRLLAPNFLVGQLDLRDPAAGSRLEELAALVAAIGGPLTLEIVLPNERPPEVELLDAAADVRDAGLAPAAVVASPQEYLKSWQPNERWPEVPPLEAIYDAARRAFPDALIGGGMLSYFTELNRKRPPAGHIDFVTHTMCPIVHDADDRTVMDNLESLPWIAESVRAIAGDRPYRIGPSAIGMRQNPYGAAPVDNVDNRRIAMAINDPRQRGLFGAAWNLGLAAHAARAGVEAVALSAPTGPFGVVYRPLAYPQPWFEDRGGVYPLYHVIRGLAASAGKPWLDAVPSNASAVQAIAWQDSDHIVLWLANLTRAPQRIRVTGVAASEAEVARLDAESFAEVTRAPDRFGQAGHREKLETLELEPYALARLVVAA